MTLGRFYAALGNVNASHYKQTKHFPHFHKRHKHKRTVAMGKNIDFITDHNFRVNNMNS